jgi:hypothetical protein
MVVHRAEIIWNPGVLEPGSVRILFDYASGRQPEVFLSFLP